MDWLMEIVVIGLIAAAAGLVWKNYRTKKEAERFAEKVETALDAIVTGKEWDLEEELEDSLWGRTCIWSCLRARTFRRMRRSS